LSNQLASTKRCGKCGSVKPVSEFARKSKTRIQAWCKCCSRANSQNHYRLNKARYIQRAQARKERIRVWIKTYKRQLSCAHCGEDHPACLQFHHLDPDVKELSIAKAIAYCWGIPRIERELSKCSVLCANCHMKEHWKAYWEE
jgi:transcription elongation factor Elf1